MDVREVVEIPLGYPTTTIWIDESRARAAGGRFFAVAALKIRHNGEVARALQRIRDERSFSGEFKFKDVTRGTLSAYYDAIDLLESPDCQVHAFVVDAEQYNPFDTKPFWRVHADLVTQLLVGAINKRELVTALIDRISTPKDLAYEDVVKAAVNKRFGNTGLVSAALLDSRTCDLLQLTDLIAGAVAYDRGLRVETYRTKETEKKKLCVRLKAALGGVDLTDGRTARVNILTCAAPSTTKRLSRPSQAKNLPGEG